MPCKFRIRPKQEIGDTYHVALREIKRFGAKYDGDETGGRFDLKILGLRFKGIARVEGNVIAVEIKEKPLLIPCSLIETSTKEYVANLI